MKKLLYTIAVVTMLFGCGPLQQDPMKGLPNGVTGVPDTDNSGKPGDPDAIRPDLLSAYDFKVDEESMITLDARILEKNYVLSLDIQNLDAFEGATYDPLTRTFVWTPKRSVLNGEMKKKFPLEVVFIGSPEDGKGVIFQRKEVVQIEVSRDPGQPMITSWSTLPQYVQEGSWEEFTFWIKDEDAGPDMTDYPTLMFNKGSGSGLSPYITITNVTAVSATEFSISARLDLRNVEFTTNIQNVEITIAPRSRFGATGNEKTWTISVYTSLTKPTSSWIEPVEFKVGEEKTWTFTVSDLRSEGKLSTDVASIPIPKGSKLSCSGGGSYVLVCNFTWKPEAKDEGDYTPNMLVKSEYWYNRNANETRNDVFALNIKAVK